MKFDLCSFCGKKGVLGFSVMVDENGDAEGNYTLLALLDKEGGEQSMQPVARFTYQRGDELPVSSIN